MKRALIKCSIPTVRLSIANVGSGDNHTSLTQAILDYREANRRFNELPNSENPAQDEAAVQWTYQRPLDVLCAWTKPAQSLEEVHQALKMIRDDSIYIDSYGDALFKAVLGYFERNPQSESQRGDTNDHPKPSLDAPDDAPKCQIEILQKEARN